MGASRMFLFLSLVVAALGCTEPPAPAPDPALLAELVSDKRPSPQHALQVRFEGGIELLGYDVDTTTVQPKRPFHVTWYWHVKQAPGTGWAQFTHALDAKGESRLNLDRARVLAKLLPAERWSQGKYIRDVQEITLPADWKSKAVELRLGFWRGDRRMTVSAGPSDDERRAIALRLPVVSGDEPPVPDLRARRLTAPLKLDGQLDEADWLATPASAPFVNTMRGSAGAFEVSARAAYDADALYVGFEVADDHLKSRFTKHDEHLWEQDCVEVMLDPDGDGKNYFEMQVSPRGVRFDTRYDSRRRPRPFGDTAWDSLVRSGVSVRGTLEGDEGEQKDDQGYTVEMAIPWRALQAGPSPAAAPTAGARWRMNLFVMDAREKGVRAVGWSPPLVGDFHTLERFGTLHFPAAAADRVEAATGAVVAPQPAPGPATPPATKRTPTAQKPAPAPAE